MPLGEALWENADLQLCIPTKFKRAPPLPPPPGPAVCTLLLDMLALNPDARPSADQLEARVRSALKEDSCWWNMHQKTIMAVKTINTMKITVAYSKCSCSFIASWLPQGKIERNISQYEITRGIAVMGTACWGPRYREKG